jgi:molybdate transport system substrate-binding protein
VKNLLTLALAGLLTLIPVTGCARGEHKAITAFCAAGAKPAVDEIGQKFEKQYGFGVEISYGAGGEVLNRMIVSRSGDVYIAPEQGFMEAAREKGAIDPATIKSVAYMIPVIAVKKGNPRNIITLADLANPGIRVAITRPETTLLGRYAREIFRKAELAEAIEKNIVTQAARPDSLLTMLVMGQADAGITWHFYQVQAAEQIEVVFLPAQQLTGIGEMQAAVSAYTRDRTTALQFIDFATAAEGKSIFRKHGYIGDAEEVKKYWR